MHIFICVVFQGLQGSISMYQVGVNHVHVIWMNPMEDCKHRIFWGWYDWVIIWYASYDLFVEDHSGGQKQIPTKKKNMCTNRMVEFRTYTFGNLILIESVLVRIQSLLQGFPAGAHLSHRGLDVVNHGIAQLVRPEGGWQRVEPGSYDLWTILLDEKCKGHILQFWSF